MPPLEVHIFICRSDNFGLLLHDPATGLTASIDTPDAAAIEAELAQRGWRLSHIFNTHHHHDHVPGNLQLKQRFGCSVVGAECDAHRIPGIDIALADGERFDFGGHEVRLIETPGHTMGSVCFYLPADGLLFTGDTLFSLGCGRMFEGTPQGMWKSLCKIRDLPDETLVYCGHEYTVSNAEFALEMEPGNSSLATRAARVRELRRNRLLSLPVSLGMEKATNPFLRADSPEIRRNLSMEKARDFEVFGRLRALKDEF